MNRMILLVAFAALTVTSLIPSTAQAQRFGNRFRSNNSRPVLSPFRQPNRGPIMQRVFDFGTIYGPAQRSGRGGLPMSDSAISSSQQPILEWGTLGDNNPTRRTTPFTQQSVQPRRTTTSSGLNFIPQTRPIPNAAPWVTPNYYHGGLLP